MSNDKYFYSVELKDFDNSHEFVCKNKHFRENDLETLAELMANDYVDNHDGWELRHWPYNFYIWDSEEKYLGCVRVNQEYTPYYYGTLEEEDE